MNSDEERIDKNILLCKEKEQNKKITKQKEVEKSDSSKAKKNVMWDWKSLEEQELERKNNPPKKKINEPKTPYQTYEQDDDDYLIKINQINKLKPTVNFYFILERSFG